MKPLDEMVEAVEQSAAGIFTISARDTFVYDKGIYRLAIAKPSKRLAASLAVDREIGVLFTTFTDLQARTVFALREALNSNQPRLESTVAIVVHRDPWGDSKLKNWGRESGLSILPIFFGDSLPYGDDFERLLCFELYSHDPFDVTGPVSGDAQFFGRRDEAQDLARKLQHGHIRSALGIRKIGKTSIINRIVSDVRANYDCVCVMIDCSRDIIWSLKAAELLQSIANGIETAATLPEGYLAVSATPNGASIDAAVQSLVKNISAVKKPVVLFFDEVDYITPTSPTGDHWRQEFNIFWRNFRTVVQEVDRQGSDLSFLVCGVSSKWFSVESIDGVENAALALIPEEYLSPLSRGATVAMIKKIGRVAGLQFTDEACSRIGEACADLPFWVRKACSFIHRQFPVDSRPLDVGIGAIGSPLDTFIQGEGATLAQVALAHLFRVYPELEEVVTQCYCKETSKCSKHGLTVLRRYGIISDKDDCSLRGDMMMNGFELFHDQILDTTKSAVVVEPPLLPEQAVLSEWAEELAVIGKRRNLLEKRLRPIVVNFIRADSLSSADKKSAADRILSIMPESKRSSFRSKPAEIIVE